MVVFLDDLISQIPMAALVAVMIMVSIGTFSWDSIRKIREYPPSSSLVMIATVIVVVFTHNLALGVFVGVLLASLFFANKVGRFMGVRSERVDSVTKRYKVVGQVFFASSDAFTHSFDFKEVNEKVIIDLNHAHFWDVTAVAALDKVVMKFRREGAEVELVGMNEASQTIVDRFGVHDKQDVSDILEAH
jgi:SulP family sulfate permease